MRGVGLCPSLGGRREGGLRGRGYMYTYGRLIYMYGRNQHNFVKQLSSFFFFFFKWKNGGPLLSQHFSSPSYWPSLYIIGGFAGRWAGKESTCNSGDPSSIPGSGRSPGEGIGYPRRYSWAPLVAQLVKNLPAMWETWVRSPGREDPLEKGKAPRSSVLPWRIPWTVQFMGSQRAGHSWAPSLTGYP